MFTVTERLGAPFSSRAWDHVRTHAPISARTRVTVAFVGAATTQGVARAGFAPTSSYPQSVNAALIRRSSPARDLPRSTASSSARSQGPRSQVPAAASICSSTAASGSSATEKVTSDPLVCGNSVRAESTSRIPGY